MRLSEQLLSPNKKAMVVDDCCKMIDQQLAAKSGMSGIALKTAFSALKGVKPGYIPYVVEQLLPQFLTALDPLWSEGIEKGDPAAHLIASRSQTADAMLGITDARVKNTQRQIIKGTYEKFRGSAKKHVEEAVPDLAKIVDKYTKV
ncbi:hypothetical protein PN465_06230 [Nodularia spumigena CS-584]|jgi:hypothetical protein|uniref:Uncharacterized protein n=1 Tax=Nodularia spumigena UHCC 0060 TaxID=3110300 RepID=A0ABU5UT57_NODSP|nr:hypothetical protein [Nodularia spumigena]AHJ27676.1 hypothetical protein NSP_13360 [Nodularia spumigena CCY9414]EAW46417.1 hypothetical protein N9414_06829 [Nodularia spumigena CCY9414]MDB9381821.1 hypothetical protein [Nodularia spumigena CS-584]MEA5526007.1 hypothetical protein [Nodularia spumigena UHCC 0143]MEA5557902.1 hypothetical protein [Nodularia spumigena CH309]